MFKRNVIVIAEAGVNHNGDLNVAKKMVDVAKDAGVDYVKFQTFKPESLVSKFAEKATYQKNSCDDNESQLSMLKKLTLTDDDFIELKRYCDLVGVGFLSSPFDIESVEFLDAFNMDYWKIPSGEITNLPYLEKIARTGKDIIVSTGMCNVMEICKAVSILEENGDKEIILLHCNTQYPTPYEHINLNAMNTIAKITGKKIGYSDHSQGIEVPIAAVAMGAVVIEKHFTLDRNMEGPDHMASLDPKELKSMVSGIRNIEKALGNGIKELSPSEIENRVVARKSIVAAKSIRKGDIFSINNITTKRPGNGISPMKWYDIIGKVASRDFLKDELIEL